MIPGQIINRNVCDTSNAPATETYYENVPYQVTVPVKRCQPSRERQCTSYQIPEYTVTSEEKVAEVEINVPVCK